MVLRPKKRIISRLQKNPTSNPPILAVHASRQDERNNMNDDQVKRWKYLIEDCKSNRPNISVGGRNTRETVIAADEEITKLRAELEAAQEKIFSLEQSESMRGWMET